MLSRKVTCSNSHGQDSSYFIGWQEYEKNPYDPVGNPSGIIQLGLAENQLSFDLIESWMARNPESTDLLGTGSGGGRGSRFRELALFQDYHGLPEYKNGLAYYMSEIRQNRVEFEADNIVLTAGATSANEILMFCLAEPGDAFLIPTPYYPGFDRDLRWRTGVEIIPIHCSGQNAFRITRSALESAYEEARKLNLTVKGLILTNPSNPLGTTLTPNELNLIVRFSIQKGGIHIVSDEIYAGTVFDSPRFISVLETVSRAFPDRDSPIWNRVHLVSSLSKDLGLPGFRLGLIYSRNRALTAAATKMSSFGLISSQSQFLMARVLADRVFVKKYIAENQRRLRNRQRALVSGLEKSGIPCLRSNGGLFCWVDLRRVLGDDSSSGGGGGGGGRGFGAEMELWKEMIFEFGLNVSPGSSCHCRDPGWFRVCFANVSEETLRVAVERIRAVVESRRSSNK